MLRQARPAVPSLFVYGQGDALVPPERTEMLMGTWSEGCASSFVHEGAHLVPTCRWASHVQARRLPASGGICRRALRHP
jgi:fermentation-respiration switch protein FrsA (DUF1100 family)